MPAWYPNKKVSIKELHKALKSGTYKQLDRSEGKNRGWRKFTDSKQESYSAMGVAAKLYADKNGLPSDVWREGGTFAFCPEINDYHGDCLTHDQIKGFFNQTQRLPTIILKDVFLDYFRKKHNAPYTSAFTHQISDLEERGATFEEIADLLEYQFNTKEVCKTRLKEKYEKKLKELEAK